MIFALAVIVALAAVLLFLRLRFGKPKLSPSQQENLEKRFDSLRQIQDPVRRILEGDKLMDLAMFQAGFKGSTGEKLKNARKYLKNVEGAWAAHKLRNRIAHEHDVRLSPQEADAAIDAFRRASSSFYRHS